MIYCFCLGEVFLQMSSRHRSEHSSRRAALEKIVIVLVSSDSAGDYEKVNGVCLLGYNSRYVTYQTSACITAVANSDNLTSNSSLSVR